MYINSNLEIITNFTTYKPKYLLLRVLGMSLISVVFFTIIIIISNDIPPDPGKRIHAYLIVVGAFNCILEGNLIAIKLMDKYNKLNGKFVVRALIIIAITSLLSILWLRLAELYFVDEKLLQYSITQITIFGGVLIAIIQLLIVFISNLTKDWLSSKKEIDELKQAKLLSDYNLLKDRLNPHFLFNNLSVLKSLIRYNSDGAEVFTQNFTNVYRYVLKSHEETLVSLQEELKFLESYIALHKERIGEGLTFEINIGADNLTKKTPPLSLELLVENAIKHNTANKLRPLHISIYTKDQKLIVENNLNKKETTYSTYTGLKTLNAQYKFIANQEIEIVENEESYIVKIPLL